MAGRREKPLDANTPAPVRELAESLRELRHACGLTLRELSARSSYGMASLSRALSGDQVPSIELLEALLDACEVPETERGAWRQLHRDANEARLDRRRDQHAVDRAKDTQQVQVLLAALYAGAGNPSVRSLEAASGVPRTAVHRLVTGSFSTSTPVHATELTDVLVSLTPIEDRERAAEIARHLRNTLVHHYGATADPTGDGDVSAAASNRQKARAALQQLARRAVRLDARLADGDLSADEDVTHLMHQLQEDLAEAHHVLCHTCGTPHEFRPLTHDEAAFLAVPATQAVVATAAEHESLIAVSEPSDRAPAPASDETRGERPLSSVQRAMRLLEVAAAHGEGAPAKQLAREAGLPLPTTYHLLRTLTQQGYLRRENGVFVLGEVTMKLGTASPTRDGAAAR